MTPWSCATPWLGDREGAQFQSGISSAVGLRHHLARTIPKRGGTTCRVDLKPIQIRTKPA